MQYVVRLGLQGVGSVARYNFKNATLAELKRGLNSENQDENDAAVEEQMRRVRTGETPTTATANKIINKRAGGLIDGVAKRGKTKLKRAKGKKPTAKKAKCINGIAIRGRTKLKRVKG